MSYSTLQYYINSFQLKSGFSTQKSLFFSILNLFSVSYVK